MGMTSRELVYRTMEFRNRDGRAPREMWALPWAWSRYGDELRRLQEEFPSDTTGVGANKRQPKTEGNPYAVGTYVDPWGCRFVNNHEGVHGEVKEPIVALEDENWDDTSAVNFPYEWLEVDVDSANAQCRQTDRFVGAGACPRPFEQLQFMRTSEQLFVDLAFMPSGLRSFMSRMHTFYCDVLEAWAKTEVDALSFMDDWGSQNALLINPELWRKIFKPMYKDYIDIAHRAGKKATMHSDGHILSIYPDLVELGLDSINSQIFCMGVENLKPFAGRICFNGEVDRQELLSFASVEDVRKAVRSVHEHLWKDGGCFAQCEFSAGNRPENVRAVYETWAEVLPG